MVYVKINDTTYPAKVSGELMDRKWDSRKSKTITLTLSYEQAMALFVNDVPWSVVESYETAVPKTDENGTLLYDENNEVIVETVTTETVYDNSEYCVAGAVTDNRDGTVSVKMGQKTAEEMLAELMEVLNND